MKILAVDSSGTVASVAIVEDNNLISEYTINYKKTHSQTLLPMLDDMIKITETELTDIDGIAVAKGPGSFTGLRIGAATVKGLALALDKPIVGVSTIEGLAMNLFGVKSFICPLMDARRNQVYTGLYRFEKDALIEIKEPMAIGIEEVIRLLNELGESVIFMGDGVDVYKDVIEKGIEVSYEFAPAHLNKQRAAAVAVCGMKYLKQGGAQSADTFAPDYLRLSQAERERMEKGNA